VVDAAILVAAARGRSSGAVLAAAGAAVLVTTDRVVQESRRRIELGLKRPDLLAVIDALVAEMTVVPVAALAPALARSEIALRDAAPSRNGSVKDAHVLAWLGASRRTSGRRTATLPEQAPPLGPRRT
jgi:hypothetical protein